MNFSHNFFYKIEKKRKDGSVSVYLLVYARGSFRALQ